jgi:hypothetical protein
MKPKPLNGQAASLLADLLLTVAALEQTIEMKRQFLAMNENFEPYSAF